MNLLDFRDRVRAKAIEVGLSYSEIEGLTDVNELLNQQMPCLMYNYEQESNDYSTPSTVLTPRIYLITNIHDEDLTQSAEYQRDWIITKKNELREKYVEWLKVMSIDGTDYVEIINDTQLQLQERVSVEGFLLMEAQPQFRIYRGYCVTGADSGGVIDCPTASYLVEYENGTDIESGVILSGGSKTIQVPNPVKDLTLNLFYTTGDDTIGFTNNIEGTINTITTSLTNVSIEVNSVAQTTPFDITVSDNISVTFDAAASDGVLELGGSYV